jgi:hypothetical protein
MREKKNFLYCPRQRNPQNAIAHLFIFQVNKTHKIERGCEWRRKKKSGPKSLVMNLSQFLSKILICFGGRQKRGERKFVFFFSFFFFPHRNNRRFTDYFCIVVISFYRKTLSSTHRSGKKINFFLN